MTELRPLTDRLETVQGRVIPADHFYSCTILFPPVAQTPRQNNNFGLIERRNENAQQVPLKKESQSGRWPTRCRSNERSRRVTQRNFSPFGAH